ncbi:MAG: DNA mismatch repair protein MutS, partial [Proteobacteria bacterium]
MPQRRSTEVRPADDTPVMRQFRSAKEQHPDALVFFRMGDFYELFYDDAVIASRALELTLTSRNKNSADEIPMAGLPHHAASGYVQRLLEQGFKVAICEQMADPKTVKGIVPREVVRVVSPGLTYDDNGLTPGQNHWVVALGELTFAALDFTTGELLAATVESREALLAELVRFDPKEIVLEPEVGQDLVGAIATLRPRTSRRIAARAFADELPGLDSVVAAAEAETIQPSVAARAAAAALVAVLRT